MPGAVKEMHIPRLGPVIYNAAETVKYFPQFSQPAIMPPVRSEAGRQYAKTFENVHGFNPYTKSSGFVTNFALAGYRAWEAGAKNIENPYYSLYRGSYKSWRQAYKDESTFFRKTTQIAKALFDKDFNQKVSFTKAYRILKKADEEQLPIGIKIEGTGAKYRYRNRN